MLSLAAMLEIADDEWSTMTDSVHRECIVPGLLREAATQLACEEFMRCVCEDRDCNGNQIRLRAWHLFWTAFAPTGHDPGDEDASIAFRWEWRYA